MITIIQIIKQWTQTKTVEILVTNYKNKEMVLVEILWSDEYNCS